MKAWKAALAAAIATAAIALIVVAPMAQSSKRPKRLKMVTVDSVRGTHATAKCPTGIRRHRRRLPRRGPVAWRPRTRLDERRWTVGDRDDEAQARPTRRAQQAICAKGAGGFKVTDVGEAG